MTTKRTVNASRTATKTIAATAAATAAAKVAAPTPPNAVLESLLVSTNRMTRIAAQATGSKTPASVWRTLSILGTDGPLRVGALAASSRISQPGMTKLLPQLIEDGFVYRIADVSDSRAWLIAISEKGRRALADWRVELAESLKPLFGALTDAEWATLAGAAEILAARIAADTTPDTKEAAA